MMKTRSYLFVLFAAVLVASACGRKKEKLIEELQLKNVQLQQEFEQKDSLMNELFTTINMVEKNLSDITLREKAITSTPTQELRGNANVRDRVMQEIMLINNILEDNKKRIALLNDQLKKLNINVASLQENIRMLTERLQEREEEIARLKDLLAKQNFDIRLLNATVDTLRAETAMQSQIISQQEDLIGEMNTVWYVMGSRKELTDRGIIDKSGGFISSKMKMSSRINLEHFTIGDIRELREIGFSSKKAEIVTVHPEGSFRLLGTDKSVTGLEILQPAEFWKSSRFLVIITK